MKAMTNVKSYVGVAAVVLGTIREELLKELAQVEASLKAVAPKVMLGAAHPLHASQTPAARKAQSLRQTKVWAARKRAAKADTRGLYKRSAADRARTSEAMKAMWARRRAVDTSTPVNAAGPFLPGHHASHGANGASDLSGLEG